MAPPAHRRPNRQVGFSRRAQYSLFIGYIIVVISIFVAVLLLVTARFDPKGHVVIRSLLGDIASPFSSAGRGVLRGFSGAADGVAAYVSAGSKNNALNAEVRANRTRLIEGQNAKLENIRLKRLLSLSQTEASPAIVARLISSTGASSRRYAMLDKGALQHVGIGQPVRTPEGLVGQVVQTGLISSQVLLIEDTGNVVPVKRVKDGITALASGTGDGLISVHPLTPGYNPFKPGDVFVTTGAGGVYPPGIPVCVAVSIDHDGANARPLADPNGYDLALVEAAFVAALPEPTEIKTKAKPKKRRTGGQ